MCLGLVYRGKKKKEVLAKLPEMVTCWKIVQRRGNQHGSKFVPEWYAGNSLFLAGWNTTKPFLGYQYKYEIAFHAFRTKKAAEKWRGDYKHTYLVKCKTRKRDIVAIGKQRDNLCIVTKRIWIPKPPKKRKKIA